MKSTKAPIVTQEDLDLLIKREQGKFMMVISGKVVSINGKAVFNKDEVEYQFDHLVKGLHDIIKNPVDQMEYSEALDGLETLMIIPFRIH